MQADAKAKRSGIAPAQRHAPSPGRVQVRYRRFPVVTGYSGERPFTEPIAATRHCSENRSSCPIGTPDPSGALVRALVNVTRDRGRGKIPSHANMARCQRCELRATLSFLGQYVPRTGSSEPGPT